MHNQCEPNYQTNGKYTPCSIVDENNGYVFYKVDNDQYQYLLLPLKKITGIEDGQLLADQVPNYFYMSWWGRDLVSEKLNKKIQEQNIALAVNSLNTRSQDQLHVHISCLAKPVRDAINQVDFTQYDSDWHVFPTKLQGDTFNFKKMSRAEFQGDNIFKIVNDKVIKDGKQMKYSTIAIVDVNSDQFLILEAEGSFLHGIGAEELQDHKCALAQ